MLNAQEINILRGVRFRPLGERFFPKPRCDRECAQVFGKEIVGFGDVVALSGLRDKAARQWLNLSSLLE